MNARLAAARILARVIQHRQSLSHTLESAIAQVDPRDRGLVQELCYGSLRWYPQLQGVLKQLLKKPMKGKDSDILALLLIGLYQLQHTRIPDHAALTETVNACRALKKQWATGLVNGVLRQFQRRGDSLLESLPPAQSHAHPNWYFEAVRRHWPDAAEAVFAANNERPPMTLRLNTAERSREEYLDQLAAVGIAARPTSISNCGIQLDKPCDVAQLPGFSEGLVSVQDEAAQLCAPLLDLAPGQRVLDACAAPGGKTGHIAQSCKDLESLQALDIDAQRLARVQENMERLQITAHLLEGDASDVDSWWDGQAYDRILLDAPCTASGVLRRHPDGKLLKRADDIQQLAALQGKILTAMWPLLKPGGLLLYATCSIMPEENEQQIAAFLSLQADAQLEAIPFSCGVDAQFGLQLLPQRGGHDGFYYAKLKKADH